MGLARDYNSESLRSHYRKQLLVPFTYARDLSFDQMARFPGAECRHSWGDSPYEACASLSFRSHAGPYTGLMSESPPTYPRNPTSSSSTSTSPTKWARPGWRSFLDKDIRGRPGYRVRRKSPKGGLEEEIKRVEPTQGTDIYLTIDARIQTIAENALRVIGRGAAVVLDPNNGDILAMASVPSYDPNHFIPSISAKGWAAIRANKTHPLTNRAISAYSPGSTYKIVIALAGFYAGLRADRGFNCSGSVYYGRRPKPWRCWNKSGHGTLKLANAIKQSCNCFFYQYGNATKIDNIYTLGSLMGLGQKSGLKSKEKTLASCPIVNGSRPITPESVGAVGTPPTSPSAKAR